MKIILKYIITNICERKTRTIVMLTSIILSTVLLFVSFSIGTSYENAQRKMARGMAGSATISIRSAEKGGNINEEDIPNIPEIKTKAGILECAAIYKENGYYETIDLISSNLSKLNEINKVHLADGSELSDLDQNEIILPDRFTSKYDIQKGDTFYLNVNENEFEFKVKDIAAYDTVFLRHTRGATALTLIDSLVQILGKENGYSKILIEPCKGVSTDELINKLNMQMTKDKYEISKIVNEEAVASDARQKTMPFFLISFFSLTMSIFIIYSSYKVITLDRLPVIGTFRSIGASKKSVTKILLLESSLYGFLGGIIGIPLGIVVLKIILQGMGKSLDGGIEISAEISLIGIIVPFIVAVVVSLLSAWMPVRSVSNLSIKDVVLGTVEEKKVKRPVIALIGIVIFIASAILPSVVSKELLYIAGGFSLLGFIVSTILLISIITNLSSKALEKLYGVIFKNEGKLAARNIRDNKNIVQNITLLFISISAVIAITVVGDFVNSYIIDVFRGAKIEGFADGNMNKEFVQKVQNMEGIKDVLPLYVFNNEIKSSGVKFSRFEATDNIELYNSMLNIKYTEKHMERDTIDNFSKERSIIISEDCLNNNNFAIGDNITLSNGITSNSYTIVGSFKSRATDVQGVIPSNYAVSDFNAANYKFLAYTADDPDAVMVQIRNLFGNTQNWSRTIKEFNNDALLTVGTFLKPMHSMTYFIVFLAIVGIVNNLLINFMQKRHSIAMYKSIGLSNKQNIKITLIEGLSSGVIGSIIAIVVSYMEIKTIFIVAGPKISMDPNLNVLSFIIAGFTGIIINLIGSIVPIIKGFKMNLVEEIK